VRVFGNTTVRNAAGTIRISVLLHLALGIERILVLDNGSTDATPSILRRLQRRYAPIRARGTLVRAAEHGRRVRDTRPLLMADTGDAGRLDEQTALVEAVRLWVRSPGRQLAARISGRPF
jgi:glycosyltransferase involved in cell wall biosynthesis